MNKRGREHWPSQKKREKTATPKITPLISPNVLKNKLLKRIKEHKTKETQHLENNKRKLGGNEDIPIKTSNVEQSFSDEFTDSINYLQTIISSSLIQFFFSKILNKYINKSF